MDTPGFKRFKEQRAKRAADDQDYRDFLSSMTGEQAERDAGRAFPQISGGPDPAENVPDGVVYEQYLDVLSGAAARRQAEATVRRELRDREEETLRHVRQVGGGLSSSHEALRARLEGFGRPNEGA